MADSEVQVCNVALARVAIARKIGSRSENSVEAQACDLAFDDTRDKLLEAFPWPFAARRSSLATLSSTRTNWLYVYALPGDCIAPREVLVSGLRAPQAAQRISYQVEANDAGTGRVLLCDQVTAELLYTARVTTPTLWSPAFVDALEWALAAEIAMPLAAKDDYRTRALQAYDLALNRAWALIANQQREDQPPESEFVTVRG